MLRGSLALILGLLATAAAPGPGRAEAGATAKVTAAGAAGPRRRAVQPPVAPLPDAAELPPVAAVRRGPPGPAPARRAACSSRRGTCTRPPEGQNAAMIVSPAGRILWYLPRRERVYDLKTVTYRGRPHLALHIRSGDRDGVYEIRDSRYRLVRRIVFGEPYRTDLHDLQLTDAGTAYIGAYDRVRVRGVGVVTEYVVREIVVDTGRVVFEWHSLDHVPLSASYLPRPRRGIWDYFHGNSIEPPVPGDPTIIVSSRNTAAVYGIDRATGKVRWTLGGKRDDFGVAAGATRFCAQHDARRLPDGDITLFDNGGRGNTEAGCPRHQARVMRFRLDAKRRTARLVEAVASRRAGGAGAALLPVGFGSARMQPDGNLFVSWGTSGLISEVTPAGEVLYAVNLPNASYRAVRTPWTGAPRGRPALVARRRRGGIEAWASWNGATEIAGWRLLAGPGRARLRAAGRLVPFADLETRLRLARAPRFIAVQALDARGRELGRSAARRIGPRPA